MDARVDRVEVTAHYALEGKDWVVELAEEPRVHSFGRTLAKAQAAILDATALWYDVDPDRVEVRDEWDLGAELRDDVRAAIAARRAVHEAQQLAALRVQTAVVGLSSAGLATRDVAVIVGLSHQRVHQLLSGAAGDGRRRSVTSQPGPRLGADVRPGATGA